MVVTVKEGHKRSIEEAPSYGVGHRIRIEVLGILNEGTRSASELANLTGEPLSRIGHHIKELVNSGCIELARIEKVRNVDQHFYRAVQLPMVSDEEAEALPFEARQEYAAVVLQGLMSESLAALWAGKLSVDPVWMSWRWFNLDARGRSRIQEEEAAFWERVKDIEAESINRVAKSGEATTSTIVGALSFERFRPVDANAPAMHRLAPGKS